MYSKEEEVGGGADAPLLSDTDRIDTSGTPLNDDDDVENGRDASDNIQSDSCRNRNDSLIDDEDGSIDLTQVLALLLIPLLLKAESSLLQQKEDTHHSLLSPSFAVRQHNERGG